MDESYRDVVLRFLVPDISTLENTFKIRCQQRIGAGEE